MLSIEEIKRFITNDATSSAKTYARKAQRYYEADHDIENYRLFYRNGDGELIEDKDRSNIRIAHPFFTELVDQQVQYLLSGGITFDCDQNLKGILSDYFDDEFLSEFSELLTDVCVNGWGYMYAYIDKSGRVAFSAANTLGVIEVRDKDTDDNTNYVIYRYQDTVLSKPVNRIEVWDATDVYYFVEDGNGNIIEDSDAELNPRPHILWRNMINGSEWHGQGFGFIPFFRIDNNRKRRSNLYPIKALIDDYDLMACALSNNLQDFDSPLWAVKGFDGDNINELIKNIKVTKHVGIPEGGDIDIKTVSIPYDARSLKLELDERNIYHFGMGLNPEQIGGGNITNVVIKSRYALLDMKCSKLKMRVTKLLRELIRVVCNEINDAQGTAYDYQQVKITLKSESMTNELDNANIKKINADTEQVRINTLLNSAALLGDGEVFMQVCDVLDIDPDSIERPEPPEVDNAKATQVLQGSKSMYPITSVLQKYAGGKLTRNNAIKMLGMLGVTTDEAIAMLDDKDIEVGEYELTRA